MADKEKVQAEYNDQSITKLKGPDRVRKRPAVIFGSDGLEGCEHSYFEILANAVDEAREGYGKKIITTVYRDRSIEVEDFGRGVPLGYNEAEKCYNWELIYCELYAGGKYSNNDGNSAYEYSLGLNGLGACATQYSSEYMDVKSYSGGTLSEISFKKGYPVSKKLKVSEITDPKKQSRTGTVVRWLPDLEVFTDINIPIEFFEENLRRQSVVNAGIKFILRRELENGKFVESEYCYENGISDYINEITKDNSLTSPVVWKLDTMGKDREDKKEYKLRAEVAFCVSTAVSTLEYYHNSSYLEYGGAPDKAVRTAFAYALDKYIRSQGKYNKNESKVAFSDIIDCIVVIINSSSTYTSYENQTKKAINNVFIAKALTKFIEEKLEVYFAENPTEAQVFANQVLIAKRSREMADKTRVDIKKKLSGTMDVASRVEKFVGCRSKDPEKRELYIVEGDSAMSSCKLGRNAEFQAIIPVRGKTLNCMKSTYAKIFESKIICDLLRVIGCGVEIDGKIKGDLVKFDMNALRWSKIIICTDADEDGFQIRTLLLTLFYRLLPTLISENRVFIAESPLFEITCGDETYFAYNEPEKAEILSRLGDKKYILQRSKGLGENEPDMMWKTTMNPATRRLIAVSPADADETLRMFETLLGDDLAERKRFIAENASRYTDEADI
ncbi:MAG: toprim domain-containing protein [Eubacteriales bacterium]|nr:toprim domain-containing protein [Eubacteriales bacterium]